MTEKELDQIEREFETLSDGHPEYRHMMIILDGFGQKWTLDKRPGKPMLQTSSTIEGLEEEEWP